MSNQIPEWAMKVAKQFRAEVVGLSDKSTEALAAIIAKVAPPETVQHQALLELIEANHRANGIIGAQAEEMKGLQAKIDHFETCCKIHEGHRIRTLTALLETKDAIRKAIVEARSLECNTDPLVDDILEPALLLPL